MSSNTQKLISRTKCATPFGTEPVFDFSWLLREGGSGRLAAAKLLIQSKDVCQVVPPPPPPPPPTHHLNFFHGMALPRSLSWRFLSTIVVLRPTFLLHLTMFLILAYLPLSLFFYSCLSLLVALNRVNIKCVWLEVASYHFASCHHTRLNFWFHEKKNEK